MREGYFQSRLLKRLRRMFPGCIAEKVEWYTQGYPDVIVLYGDRWAVLECKRERDAEKQKNQEYYVDMMNRMSFARIVYPENMEEILHDLQRAFES